MSIGTGESASWLESLPALKTMRASGASVRTLLVVPVPWLEASSRMQRQPCVVPPGGQCTAMRVVRGTQNQSPGPTFDHSSASAATRSA